ncbi:peroxiredoxin [Aerosakkonemataceae cyanobacterium BLCC-F50]|uniref:Peroxiredoxin n=1 Tax=Floridaenema flaviceps BLCC-F50 TaxID=3153642 RepID=A0ABV4XW78_9CYAN
MQNFDEAPKDVLVEVPKNLPAPIDDGACNHLLGLTLPSVNLASTRGKVVNLSEIPGWLVIYCYPMTGKPGRVIPDGWIQIPGAAGCTPQSCSFRDRYSELKALNCQIFGMSTQSTEDQLEAAERLHLPFELLSDAAFEFAEALRLPMFEVEGMRLLKRVTLIVKDGKIVKYFYPVFPPDKNIDGVLSWLRQI